jgi:parallel beta-helix repeat protein
VQANRNRLYQNDLSNCVEAGILLTDSDENHLEENESLSNSLSGSGIELAASDDNYVIGNAISDHFNGLNLTGSSAGNMLFLNALSSNGYGIHVQSGIAGNWFVQNSVWSNTVGIKIAGATNNVVYFNEFFSNTHNLQSPAGGNFWNSFNLVIYQYGFTYPPLVRQANVGNHYDDFTSSTDNNLDGICDTQCPLGAEPADQYPLWTTLGSYSSAIILMTPFTISSGIRLIFTRIDIEKDSVFNNNGRLTLTGGTLIIGDRVPPLGGIL